MSHPTCSYCGERVAIPCETKCEVRVCDEEGQLQTKFEDLGLIYLGTPYTKYFSSLDRAWKEAARITADMARAGAAVYSPITHGHPLSIYGGIDPFDHELWMQIDTPMMNAADTLVVADMLGWNDSRGIEHEITHFRKLSKPIYLMNHCTLELEAY